MVGAPFPGRYLARDLIASVEDALQTPTLVVMMINDTIIITDTDDHHFTTTTTRTIIIIVTIIRDLIESVKDALHQHQHRYSLEMMTQLYNILIFIGAGAFQNFFVHFLYPLSLQRFLCQTKIFLLISLIKNHTYLFPRGGTGSVASAARWAGQRLPPIFSSEFSISSAPLGFDI